MKIYNIKARPVGLNERIQDKDVQVVGDLTSNSEIYIYSYENGKVKCYYYIDHFLTSKKEWFALLSDEDRLEYFWRLDFFLNLPELHLV